MTALPPGVTAALASLQDRWGGAAPRAAGSGGPDGRVAGALATVPLPAERAPALREDRIVRTGFAELDAILGPGGLPRQASVAIRGDGSSGRTTLALRLAAQAQADGAIVAWVDVARSFDPVEAITRGVRPEWLVVVTPVSLDEGLAIAGALLAGRSVDLLVVDLPPRPDAGTPPARIAERLQRLAAHARRSETLLVILEPPRLAPSLASAVVAATGVRLELARRSWIRLGRDVVGQRTVVTVARNRFGPPGRRADLRILYAEGGGRDACLLRDDLLRELPDRAPEAHASRNQQHATSSSLLAASSPRARPGAPELRIVALRPDRPGRPAVDGRHGDRRLARGAGARGPAGAPPGERPPARTRGDLPRPGPRR